MNEKPRVVYFIIWTVLLVVPFSLFFTSFATKSMSSIKNIFQETEDGVRPFVIEITSDPISSLLSHQHPAGESVLTHAVASHHTFIAPEDLWITGYLGGEVKNGPSRILHHATLFSANEKRGECFHRVIDVRSSRILSLHKDYPSGFGQFIKQGTALTLSVLFHNTGDLAFRDVSLSLKLLVLPARSIPKPLKRTEIYLAALSDTSCGHYFSVPAFASGYALASNIKGMPNSFITFPDNGEIVMLHPHFHVDQGGKALSVFLNSKKLYEFVPLGPVSRDGPLLPFVAGKPRVLSVKKGDRVTLSTSYDNATPEVLTDAMAQLWVYFSPQDTE